MREAQRGFHPEARYEFRLDLDGDAVEHLTYRVSFWERDSAGRQSFEMRQLLGAEARDPGATGSLFAFGSTESMIEAHDGTGIWTGLARRPFFIEPTVLKAVWAAFQNGTRVELGTWQPADAVNLFAGTTVHSIVLEVPDAVFEGLIGPDRQIGLWCTTSLATDAGGWRPINRAGLPMIQPIFNPDQRERASLYNTTHPSEDRANDGQVFAKAHGGCCRRVRHGDRPGSIRTDHRRALAARTS